MSDDIFRKNKHRWLMIGTIMALGLTGCGKPMANDQIIAEVRKCKDAGLLSLETRNAALHTIDIQCSTRIYH